MIYALDVIGGKRALSAPALGILWAWMKTLDGIQHTSIHELMAHY